MRFERKYNPPNNIRSELKCFMRINNIKEIFPSRKISSIYYEQTDFKSFFDSEDGNQCRTKVRLRYYNNNFNNGIIEYKIKESELGYKKYFNIKDAIKNSGSLSVHIDNLDLEIPKEINNSYPILLVEYDRDYYANLDNRIRITYDYNIKFRGIFKKTGFLTSLNVIEFKYDKDVNLDSDFFNKLIEEFNLNLTRSSKYCKGIEICF